MTTKPVVTNLFRLRNLDITGYEYRVEGVGERDYYKHRERLRGKAENENEMYLETYDNRIHSFCKLRSIPEQIDLVGPWRLSEVEEDKKKRVLIRGYVRHYLSSKFEDHLVSPTGITTEVVNWEAVSPGDSRKGVFKVLKYVLDLIPLPDRLYYLSLDVGYRLMHSDISKWIGREVFSRRGPRLRSATLKRLSADTATLVDYTTSEEFNVNRSSVRRSVSLAKERPNIDTRMDPPDRFHRIKDVARALQDIVHPRPKEIRQLTVLHRRKMRLNADIKHEPPLAVKVPVSKYVDDISAASDIEVLTLLRRFRRISLCPEFQNIVAIGHDAVFFRNMNLVLNGREERQPGYIEMIKTSGGEMEAEPVQIQAHTLRAYLDAIDDADATSMFAIQIDPANDAGKGNWYSILKNALKSTNSKSQFMKIDRKRPATSAYGLPSAMNFALQMHSKGGGVPYRIQFESSIPENLRIVAISAGKRKTEQGWRRVGAVCSWKQEDDWNIAYSETDSKEELEAGLLEDVIHIVNQGENLIAMSELSEWGNLQIRKMTNITGLLRDEFVPTLGFREAHIRAFKGIGTARGPSTPKNFAMVTGCTAEYSGGYITPTGRGPPRWPSPGISTGTPIPVHVQIIKPSGTEDVLSLLEMSVALANYHPNSLVNYSFPAPLHFAKNARSFEGEPL